jgi:hypothetical protein
MEEKKKDKGQFSNEELQQICGELSQRLQRAQEKLAEINAANIIQRLNFLFKVVEHAAMFDPDFVDKTISEIQDTLTLQEDTSDTDTKIEK